MDNSLKQKRSMMTSVGLKVVMVFTGLIFVIFVLFHMYGNLRISFRPEAYNHYAKWLKHGMLYPVLLHDWFIWIFRICLILALLGHMGAVAHLVVRNYRACGTRYKVKSRTRKKESQPSRTMKVGGVTILLLIVFHILHFAALKAQIGGDYHRLSPYERMVASLNLDSQASVCALIVYAVVITLVSFRVWHSPCSALTTLGAGRRGVEAFLKRLSALCGLALFISFLALPFTIAFGFIE